jgi:threonine aldolase
VILENTHNRCGGVILSPEYTRQVADLARAHHLKFHLDGARLFNAAVGLGVPVTDLTGPVDSVTFCLSKALCAPVGSVLCGSREFIHAAHRLRKQLGGGMRQAGVLAAAGVVALECMVERLAEDHRRAKRLAEGLQNTRGMHLSFGLPQTNMVFASLDDDVQKNTRDVVEGLKREGVLVGATGSRRFRMVTHYWVSDEAVDATLAAFERILAS